MSVSEEGIRRFLFNAVLLAVTIVLAIWYNLSARLPCSNTLNAWVEAFSAWTTFPDQLERIFELDSFSESDDGQDPWTSGMGCIPDERSREPTGQGVARVTAANVLIVFAYAVLTYCLQWGRHPDIKRKWYDTLYFVGFILTLTALITTMGSSGRFDDNSVHLIVVQSSIALSSTAIALIMRTLLISWIRINPDEDDPSFESVASQIAGIGHAIERLRVAAKAFAVRLEALETKAQSSADEYTASLGKSTAALNETTLALKNKSAEIAAIQIDQDAIAKQIADAAEAGLRQCSASIEAFVKKTAEASERISEGAQETVEAFENRAEQIQAALERMFGELEATADRLKSLDLAKKFEQATEADFSAYRETLHAQRDGLSEAILDFQKTVSESAETQRASYESAGQFFAEVQDRLSGLEALNEAINATMDTLGASPLAPEWHRPEAERIERLTAALDALATRLDKIDSRRTGGFWSWWRRRGNSQGNAE
ncbi:MAG: hypothetical protein AAGG69_14745 [Pseudomonadota bacterium]